METVVTYDGRVEKRIDCVFIRGKFFHKERDCYLHDGIYYSPFSRYLVTDEETGRRVHLMKESLNFGVVGINGNSIRFGHFSPNISKNCKLYIPSRMADDAEIEKMVLSSDMSSAELTAAGDQDALRVGMTYDKVPMRSSRVFNCINVEIVSGDERVELISDDIIAMKSDVREAAKALNINFSRKIATVPYSFNLAYNSEVMMDMFQKAFGIENFQTNSAMAKSIENILSGLTFGVEYESWDGRIPTWKCARLGLIPLRDGSLRHDNYCGFEYATVILSPENILGAIKAQCKALRRHCVFNERCSMHIHIGSIPRTKEALESIYAGIVSIQDDIYNMFPSCLRDTSKFKQKSYCGPLPSHIRSANDIVNFLSDGNELFSSFGKPHPKDRSGQSKWSINSRYSIVNMCNYYYTSRGTIEIRVSTPTFNHSKVAALVLISTLMIKEALNGFTYTTVESLLEASLKRIGGNDRNIQALHKWLAEYVTLRKKTLNKFTISDGNVLYEETFDNDNLLECKPLY